MSMEVRVSQHTIHDIYEWMKYNIAGLLSHKGMIHLKAICNVSYCLPPMHSKMMLFMTIQWHQQWCLSSNAPIMYGIYSDANMFEWYCCDE